MSHDTRRNSPGEPPTLVDGGGSAPESPPTNRPGTSISRYLVIEEIGRGGMGQVLRAYDPKLQREVALKIVHAEAISDQARARMITEAQTMARVSHPNIVAVYDVEIDESAEVIGGVVIVMEYVSGRSLRHWCRDEEPSWQTIVDVFRRAGRGLAAAHEQGVLHRDFKPDNVLVVHGAAGIERVQVTDFGLATQVGHPSSRPELDEAIDLPTTDVPRADPGKVSGKVSGKVLGTVSGAVLGTPRYMAPEQHRGQELTAAADQYAFCVALWEALVGVAPFPATNRRKRKLEGPPAWPSRSPVPRRVVEALRRGLAPSPADRWFRLDDLLEALEPRSPANRRWPPTVASLAALAAGTSLWWSWTHEREQRCAGAAEAIELVWNDADRSTVSASLHRTEVVWASPVARGVTSRLDEYASQWVDMRTEACEATTLRGEQSPAVMDLRMACLDQARAALRSTVEVLSQADKETLDNAFEVVGGLPPVSRCAEIAALKADVAPPSADEADAVDDIRDALTRARALRRAGRLEDARRLLETATTEVDTMSYEPLRSEVWLEEAVMAESEGAYTNAEAALSRALESATRWGQWALAARASIAMVRVLGNRQARYEDAMAHVPFARGFMVHGAQDRLSPRLRRAVAVILATQGKLEQAVTEFESVLEEIQSHERPDSLAEATAHNNLGLALARVGRNEEARQHIEAALETFQRELGQWHPDVAGARQNLGLAWSNSAEIDKATIELQRAAEIFERSLGSTHPNTLAARTGMGSLLSHSGRLEEAEAEYRAILPLLRERLGADHPEVAMLQSNLAATLRRTGRLDEAARQLEEGLAILTGRGEESSLEMGILLSQLGELRWEQRRTKDAREAFESAMENLTGAGADRSSDMAAIASSFAHFERDHGNRDRARELLETSWSIRDQGAVAPQVKAATAFELARLVWDAGEHERARALAQRCLDELESASSPAPELRTDAQRWLDDHR